MANQPKKYKKFVATAATATLVASAIVPVASAASFSDVADTNSHAEAINALVEAGIIKGYEDGTFKPNATLTRGHVVKMLGKWVETQGFEIPADYDKVARFTDLAVDAADQELVKYAALVKDTGVFNGLADGSLNAKGDITRENMALTLDRAYKAVFGKTLVELAEGVEDLTVTDLATAKAEAREAIQALRDLGISNVDTFNPKDTVKRGQFASFLYRTINVADAEGKLKVESVTAVNGTLTVKLAEKAEKVEVKDFTVTQAINGGEAKEVTPSKAELAEDGLTVTLTVDKVAVDATKDQSVVYTVNKVAAEAFVVAATPVVESVSADNLKEVKISFNKAVDEDSIDSTSLKLKVNKNAFTAYTTSLSEDGLELTVIANASLQQGDKVEVTIDGVKAKDGIAFEKAVKEVVVKDVVAPTVQGIKVVGPNKVHVFFSEPLTAAPTIKLNGGKTSVVVSQLKDNGTLVEVTAGTLEKGENTLSVEGGRDFANFPFEKADVKFDYTVPTTAPTYKVVASTATSIDLEFERPVTNLEGKNTYFSHTYKGKNQAKSVVKLNDAGTKYRVEFTSPFPPGATNVYMEYPSTVADSAKVKDNFGNIVGNQTISVNTENDTVKPEVASAEYNTDKKVLEIKFTEKVNKTTAENKANFVLRDEDNKVVATGTPVLKADGTTVTIAIDSLDAGSYTLEVKNIKDVSVNENVLDTVKKTFAVGDVKAPTLKSAVNTTDKKVRVTFSEAMDETDLVNAANYNLSGAKLPTGTTLTKIDGKTVELVFPSETDLNGKTISVSGSMKDLAGNVIGGLASPAVTIEAPSATAIKDADVDSINFVDEKTIKVTLKQHLSGNVDKTKILVALSANSFEIADATFVNNPDGTSTVTIKGTNESTGVATDLSNLTSVTFNADAFTNLYEVKNANINAYMQGNEKIKDQIKAELASVVAADTDSDAQLDQLTVTFSEAVKADSIQTSDFAVKDYIVTGVKSVSGKTVVLTLEESGIADTTSTLSVNLVGDVTDLKGNTGFDSAIVVKSIPVAFDLTDSNLLKTGATGSVVDGNHEIGVKHLSTLTGTVTDNNLKVTGNIAKTALEEADLNNEGNNKVAFVNYIKTPVGTKSFDLYVNGSYSWTAEEGHSQWLDTSAGYAKTATYFAEKKADDNWALKSNNVVTYKLAFKNAAGEVINTAEYVLDFSEVNITN